MFLDFVKLALRNIRHRKRRSWLTILGTMIGILAIVSLLSIGQGLEHAVVSEFQELGGNKIFISPGGGFNAQFSSTTFTLGDDDLQTIRNTRGVSQAIGMVQGSVLAKYGDGSKYVTVTGIPVGGTTGELAKQFNSIQMESGRYLQPSDQGSVIVSQDFAQDRFDREIRLRSSIEINGSSYRVVGIFTSASSIGGGSGVMMPMENARELLDKEETYDMIIAEVRPGFQPADVEEDIDRNLRQERNVEKGNENFQTRTANDIIRTFNNQLAIIRGVLLGIGAISLLVGAVGIMNTMYTSVTERTREIGVMKSVGATRKQVMLLFMIESGVIGAVGGILGAVAGVGLSTAAARVISTQMNLQFSAYIGPYMLLGSIGFAFLVGMVSGVLPARKAAKLKPAEALRY
ncbi:MAG: ABC transporter permease [Candidatus Nanosalina sp.]